MKLFIEMEDVLCDVSTAIASILELPVKLDGLGNLLGSTTAKKNEALALQPASFWEELNPLPEFNDIRSALLSTGIPIQVLSSNYSTAAENGKKAWLKQYFPEATLTLIKNKHILATRDSILIDTRPGSLQAFAREGGQTILFPQPWQKHYKPQKDIKAFLVDRIAAVSAII